MHRRRSLLSTPSVAQQTSVLIRKSRRNRWEPDPLHLPGQRLPSPSQVCSFLRGAPRPLLVGRLLRCQAQGHEGKRSSVPTSAVPPLPSPTLPPVCAFASCFDFSTNQWEAA
uniref:Uncharacterized protein n=1 Tax=Knipowitschia caucasica TaxID=637954 RepID=A0AAV2LEH6_KNICA